MHRSAHKISFERTDLDAEGARESADVVTYFKLSHAPKRKRMLMHPFSLFCAKYVAQTLNIMSP